MRDWMRGILGPAALWTVIALVVAVAVWVLGGHDYLPTSDAHAYDSIARRFLATGHLQESWAPFYKAWRPHGYTLFVAAVYWISGESPSHVVFVQVLLLAGMVGMLVAACGLVSRRRVAQHACGLLLVTYVPFYEYVYALLAEQLHFFLLAAAILLLAHLQRSWRSAPSARTTAVIAAGIGALAGLAAVTKSYLFYFPLVALCVIGIAWVLGPARRQASMWRLAVVGLVGFAVAVAPFLVRNWRAIGTPTTLTSYGGYNLYLGNYGVKVGNWREPDSSLYYSAIDNHVNRIRRTYGDEEVENSKLTRDAFQIIRNHPVTFLKKAVWQARMTLTVAGRYGVGRHATGTEAQYVVLLLLAVLGGVLWLRRAPIFVLGLLTFIAYVVLVFSVTFVINRLKEPLMPGVIVLAALALSDVAVRLHVSTSRNRRGSAAPATTD